jgi:hypothetical protein
MRTRGRTKAILSINALCRAVAVEIAPAAFGAAEVFDPMTPLVRRQANQIKQSRAVRDSAQEIARK